MKINFVVSSSPTPIGGVTTQYHFANALAALGHDVHLYHVPFWSLRIDDLDDLAWFRFHPGVQHHVGETDEMAPAEVVFGTGAPLEAGLPVHLVQGREILFAEYERQAFRTPSLKVAVASWLTDAGERWGFPAERCRVVLQGIDHDDFVLRRPIEDRERRVAMLYNAHPAKGWAVGLTALRAVKEQLPDLRASVFGTTEPDEDLPEWIDFTAAPDRSTLVDEIYNRSQAFVQASDHEGFGLTAVEAMACGCALVTTDNGGSRDYAFDGETALVVEPRDADGLARALVRTLVDTELRTRLATAGLATARTFTWERAGAAMEAELRAYVAEPDRYLEPLGPEPEPADSSSVSGIHPR